MPTNKNNKTGTSAAYEAARQERQAAEQAHADAIAAVQEAQRRHADLLQRNRSGDTTVTGMDLLAAQADITMREGLASAAANEVEAARAAEAPEMAAYWAETIAQRVTEAAERYEDETVAAITAALRRLTEQVSARNHLIHQAIQDARAAGIQPNQPNTRPFGYQGAWSARDLRVAYVDGEKVSQVKPEQAILDVLTRAVAALGYRLTASYNSPEIKPV